MKKILRFIVPGTTSTQDLIKDIAANFPASKVKTATGKRFYSDTFDWRLYKQGLVVCREAGLYRLARLASGAVVAETAWPSKRKLKFWQDLPAGPLQDQLGPILEMRALLPLAAVQVKAWELNLQNRDAKIVLRLRLERISLANRPNKPIQVTITPEAVRGYSKNLQEFEKYAGRAGLVPDSGGTIQALFAAAGHEPGSYSTKLNIQLEPTQAAGPAAIAILKSQFKVMQLNEPGVKADIDSEFLHDFRVALRRTRAGLTQIKGVFSPEDIMHYKTDLALIGRMSNRLRDLDVYLLNRDHYRGLLPEQLRPKLDHLFKFLLAERNKEHRKLLRNLKKSEYLTILGSWQKFLDSYALGSGRDGKNAAKPIIDLARKFIAKAYSRVIKRGRTIHQDTPDQELHRLRLDCKKMRYLMEFFFSLFPEETMGLLVRQSKKLQENLGDFNDLFVQQKALQGYLEQWVAKDKEFVDIATAVGGLIASLNQRQQEVRRDFARTFKRFDSPANQRLFKEIAGKLP